MLVGSLDDFGGIASSGTYDFGGTAGGVHFRFRWCV